MKRIITLIFLVMVIRAISAQTGNYHLDFDNGYYLEHVFIDNISNPNNIWEIGEPNKDNFDSSYSRPNAICTDLLNYYPINDTSSFIITNIANGGFEGSYIVALMGKYKIDTDTLNDYGTILFSPDNGLLWIDLFSDTIYSNCYNIYPNDLIFTGHTSEWKEFYINLEGFGPEFDINFGDTVKYKFTFISDSIQNNRDGWILDDLHFEDWYESIMEYEFNMFHSKVFPNPSKDLISIEFNNEFYKDYIISIYDNVGHLLNSFNTISGLNYIDISFYNSGIYFYKIKNEDEVSFGKFIKY